MEGITIQIFGSKDCEKCIAVTKAFEYHSIHYVFFDVDSLENQEICDNYNIDELPHIQAIYNDNKKVFHTYIGYISPLVFIEKMKEHTHLLEEFFNVNKNIAHQKVDMNSIKKEINENVSKAPCRNCSKNKSK